MNWLLGVNLAIAFIGAVILILGLINDDDDWISGGLISLVVIGLIGFFVIGCLVTFEKRSTKLDVEITRSEKSIILEDYGNSGKMYIFDKKVDFDIITDTTTVYFEQGYNMYNAKTDHRKVYYIDDKNNICEGEIR